MPEYTLLSEIISCGSPETSRPASITACTVITTDGGNTEGYEGRIEWELEGTLGVGESGYVTYQVEIQ